MPTFFLRRATAAVFLAASATFIAAPNPLTAAPLGPETPEVTVPLPVAAGQPAVRPAAAETALTGTFKVTKGACSGAVSGSYFRMIQPGGGATGPFVSNSDSPCNDKTYTALTPGSDGGLITETFQAQPEAPFDASGGGTASRIVAPQRFYGVNFAVATNATDPQTTAEVTPPRITHDGAGKLAGDVRSFAAAWNNQHFNQGAPKPDGSRPGNTAGPTGTLDANGAYVLEWTSQIVGGAFNNFTGVWHFEGTFVATGSGSTPSTPSGSTAPGPSGPESTVVAQSAGSSSAAPSPGSSPATGQPLARTGIELRTWLALLAAALVLAARVALRKAASR